MLYFIQELRKQHVTYTAGLRQQVETRDRTPKADLSGTLR